ncbi:helix-turn-helix transcriptional regulator [Paenibacillus tritici]|uniref:Helix-turn-helix transcriptional regulator n=1 Tax=Paenibacillus tritici TaxID=1873425 RepID=A0ABX2DPK9_9BACL|nr:AraC family transcriptional regulator [Paenibacillus tritici]NQX46560.1 helix-turn-helix transcriptional regulator [Paenibacillus tritici]
MGNSKLPLFQKNFVLQARSTTHHWEGTGPLSIKTFRNGRAYYRTKFGHYAVEKEGYLLLNEGEQYAIAIESETEVDSFCVFFKAGFAEEFHSAIHLGAEKSLDDPFSDSRHPLQFHTKSYRHSHLMTPLIENFKNSLPVLGSEKLWVDEQYQHLMQALITVHQKISQEINTLPGRRPATREELFRRLTLAYEYLHAYYNQNVSLDEVSRVACLSKNHLIRNFRQFFNRTPHQFIIEKRILEAQRLLSQTESSVTEISLSVGFENPSSFNKVFKQRTGFSPQVFRKK